MNCELPDRDQRMDDFLMGKLSQQESEAFEIHLFGCPECLEEVRIREETIKLIKQERGLLAAERPAQSSRGAAAIRLWTNRLIQERRSAWVYVGIAAALLLLLILGRQVLLKRHTPVETEARFVESPRLESVLKQTFQSSELSVSINSPRVGQNLTGEILFQWRITSEGKEFRRPLELRILNNRETLVWTTTVETDHYVLEEPLDTGVYYWTLEEQGQMLYLGKFFVRKEEARMQKPGAVSQ